MKCIKYTSLGCDVNRSDEVVIVYPFKAGKSLLKDLEDYQILIDINR